MKTTPPSTNCSLKEEQEASEEEASEEAPEASGEARHHPAGEDSVQSPYADTASGSLSIGILEK